MPSAVKKILVLGANAVGKTSLIKSVLDEPLDRNYEPTQDNWYSTTFKSSDGKQHKVQFLDTGGYEVFPALVKCYIKKADILIVVMEYNNTRSCTVASQIVNDVKKLRGNVPILSITTKCDLERVEQGQLQSCGVSQHIICSSLLNIGISEIKSFIKHNLSPVKTTPTITLQQCQSEQVPESKSKKLRLPFSKSGTQNHKHVASTNDLSYSPAHSSPSSSPTLDRRTLMRTRSNSQPESVLSRITGYRGSQSASGNGELSGSSSTSSVSKTFYKLSGGSHMSHDQLNRIYEKYGYSRKVSTPVSPSPSLTNVAASIRRSTNSIVRSVNQALSKLTV